VKPPAILTRDECEALTEHVLQLVTGLNADVSVHSGLTSSSEFARGDTHMASEILQNLVLLSVEVNGRRVDARTNHLDDAGLRALVATAETRARDSPTPLELAVRSPEKYPESPQIFFDNTVAAMAAEPQASAVHRATLAAEAAGLIAAGDLHVSAHSKALRNTRGVFVYDAESYGEFSVTARSQEHSASGWAWSGFEDWERVDVEGVITRAVDLAQRSADPVAVEPGRYTVILEPAAVAALISPISGSPTAYWGARAADGGATVFSKDPRGTNKIGLQMIDRRLGMVSDPWDPDNPTSVIDGAWDPIPAPVTWFEAGVLRNLRYEPAYARQMGRRPVTYVPALRLSAEGSPTSLDDMIASTRRGVWVNRLSHVSVMDDRTLLLTGTTRDGTFLIENGKVTKAIKNFRFTESPFFVLNQLEAWGESVRASRSVVAPRLKLRGFNFTSLTDAI
jgi:predicted Zn-dependent protease